MLKTAMASWALGAILYASPAIGQEGRFGDGHAELHHWYQTLRRDDGFGCCSGADCRPSQWRRSRINGQPGMEIKVEGIWCPVDEKHIVNSRIPEGAADAHICSPPTQSGHDPCATAQYCIIMDGGV